jgi:hypothetical protein
MSLFDRITQKLDRMLSSTSAAVPEDEMGHMALLEQSSSRIRDTLDAINTGNLIAASSTSEDLLATQRMRYQELVGGPLRTEEGFVAKLSRQGEQQSPSFNR